MGHFPLPTACWNPCFSEACSWIPLQLIQLGRKRKIHIKQEHVWVGIGLEWGVCWLRSCFLRSTTTQELLLGGFPAENHIPKIQLTPPGCKKKTNFEPGSQGKHHHKHHQTQHFLLLQLSVIPLINSSEGRSNNKLKYICTRAGLQWTSNPQALKSWGCFKPSP